MIPEHGILIHAFADGKTLQFFDRGTWIDWEHPYCPNTVHYEVRIKPEPNVTRYLAFLFQDGQVYWGMAGSNISKDWGGNIYFKRIPALDKEVMEES